GERTEGDLSYLLTFFDRGYAVNPYEAGEDRTVSMDVQPMEYPCYGNGDFRSPCFEMKDANGVYGCDLRFVECSAEKGKYSIPKLPAVYAEEEEAETVNIVLKDELTGVEVELYYGVLESLDVITRSVRVKNTGNEKVTLTKAYSAGMDFMGGEYDILHFHGRHCMERNLERTPVIVGNQSFGSRRGTSSHQHNPFLILAEKETTEDSGMCYGMSLLYSGSFRCETEKEQYGQTRMSIGIQDEMFEYDLLPGEIFYAPEVALSCADGLTALSQNYHKLIRDHICRGPHRNARRPVLINNWEATYFDFTGEKIVQIARQAADLGVEMLVLDDGWFGNRCDDYRGLGDWYVNEEKMGGPISKVVDEVNKTGMKFGLWIEPEMVSEDSDLYRAHPDWAFTIPGRKPLRGRSQLVLDFSRKEVVDHVFNQIASVIESANIEYIKMDMNRSITDIYTHTQKEQNQGRILYEYTLGVYDFIERLLTKFPNILIEGCSGGGGRFDAGMLYYTPQIWCSDDTDAIERIKIQHGTSFGYPISAVGAHVSAVPNHQTGRTTNINTRAVVAMAGTFGYELDLNTISEKEKELVRQQIKDCKKYWKLRQEGKYFRLTNPMEFTEYAAWEFVSEEKDEALLNVVTLDTHCNGAVYYVKLKGLEKTAVYVDEQTGRKYTGTALMNAGIVLPMPMIKDDYQAFQIYLKKIK
ncbi:MAG: alpha-galactosidase, partial [Ruminococcus sp.]|nr:alpha-galactosidase [Ruminococcus sp.]